MQFVRYWRSIEGDICVLIHDSVIEVFAKYAQVNPSAPESGGILLGHVRAPHLEILDASEPTFWDKRLRYFFDRGSRGHSEMAERRWRESAGLVRYVGEWHTHPEDYPTPSYIDRAGWIALANKRQDERPVLAIVVGRKALHVELVNRDGTSIVMCGASE
jgi:integrative and conjugative element protein (TIGR02256 family)